MPNKYCFECKPVTLSSSAQSQIDQFVKNGYAPEHILGSHLDFRKGVQDSAYPLTDSWKGVKGADFLSCYCSYITQCKGSDSRLVLESEYGIDNGIVSERFFRSVSSTDNILILNPHPQFVQFLETISAQITITYTDDRYAEIMSISENKSKSKSKSMSKTKVVFASIAQLENVKYNRALFFTQSLTTAQIVLAMEQLKPLLIDDKDTIIYLQIPSKHLDNKHSRPVLREVFRKDFTVNQVIMIDPAAVQGRDKKRCIIILKNTAPTEKSDVVLQNTKLVNERDKQYLCGTETLRIYYTEFLSVTKTLRSTYDTLGRDTSHVQKRESAIQFVFSKEIGHVWVSSMPANRDIIRPKYSVSGIAANGRHRKKDKEKNVYTKQGPACRQEGKRWRIHKTRVLLLGIIQYPPVWHPCRMKFVCCGTISNYMSLHGTGCMVTIKRRQAIEACLLRGISRY